MDRLAIDLGTSNTVAVLRGGDGRVRPVLFDGREQLPSAVHAGPGGVLVAGLDAERLARDDPASFEPNPKRRVDDGTVLLGEHPVAVTDVLATVLAAVAGRVPAAPAAVVLTVPAGWGAPRREVLTAAAAKAGLGAVELVSEPVAAAAYFAAESGRDLPPGAALLVVDLGAGTTDLAVVRDGRVIAQGGLDVGGLDIDAALVGALGGVVSATMPGVWHRLAAPVTAADRRDRLLLWQEVRAAKESLSRLTVAPVHVPGCPAGSHLTRDELESVAAPLLASVADLAEELCRSRGDLAGVFLVGGGSRLPLLARVLHTRLGVAPVVVERPETVVAEGALHAAAAPPPAPTAGPVRVAPSAPRTPLRRRWRSPVTALLVLLCFALPFATVSCEPLDGYGRAQRGGTTEYTAFDLAFGGTPDVRPAGHLRPPDPRHPDRLDPQPPHLAALLLLAGVLAAAAGLARDRRRRVVTAALAGAAVLALAAGQLLVTGRLADAVAAQSRLPEGKTAADMVGTGAGFWLSAVLLTALSLANAVAALRSPGAAVSGRRTGG
ncbi:Hsp70 family protein [Dactylosporangium sp. NPDC050688]|uniref:Hsp70 family protein n=1 Tax=Dactylosporangium sp. NPDC050688 TaxID=3157217 RepID=UPI0033F49A0E